MTKAADNGDVGLIASAIGAIGYVVTIALPDNATGFWGFVCDVLTLWGWGPVTSLGLAVLFGILMLTRLVRTPHWVVTFLMAVAIVAAAPVLVIVLMVFAGLGAMDGGSSYGSSEF